MLDDCTSKPVPLVDFYINTAYMPTDGTTTRPHVLLVKDTNGDILYN